MNIFEQVKESVTTRQIVEHYGLKVNRHGMACCPFHSDRTPSLKLNKRYYCFGCGEKGDQIDYVGKIFGLTPTDSARKICNDFGIIHSDNGWKPQTRGKPIKPKKTEKQIFRETQSHYYMVLSEYYHMLIQWEKDHAPTSFEGDIHPYFVEALQEREHVGYLLDTLLFGDTHDIALLLSDYAGKITNIEKHIQLQTTDHLKGAV